MKFFLKQFFYQINLFANFLCLFAKLAYIHAKSKGGLIVYMKNKKITVSIIISFIGIISKILEFVDMFQVNELLPPKTFNYVFYTSIIASAIWLLIIFLHNYYKLLCSYKALSTDKPLYIDEQIKYFKKAHKRIYVLMDSLNPETKDSKLVEFDLALENAHNSQSKVDVKLLTPNTDEKGRSRGAYDISKRNLEIYFLDILSNKDLRFSIIDDDIVIISCKKEESDDFSREFATILRKYLKDLVKDEKPINFEQYLMKRLKSLGVLSRKISIKKASEILNIPEDFLLDFVNKHHIDKVCEKKIVNVNIDIL